MTDKELIHLTIGKARALLGKREISARELTEAHLKRIEERDQDVHAYLEVFDDALLQADAADLRRRDIEVSEAPPLLGIPLAIKDNILIEGKKAGAASKILEGYTATYDATVTKKLRDTGAVFLGRTNMDEFALGGSTENSAYGLTRNPYDETRVAGGTSGGSAAAVAGDMAMAALGSDTGGSVRNPASFCGVVGLKPTYGAVSRFGLIAAASSLDQIGPLAKTVTDAEILFEVIRGVDPLDSTSIEKNTYPARSGLRRIGIPRSLFARAGEGLDNSVNQLFENAADRLEKLGFEILDIEIKTLESALASYYIINFAEVSSNLARFDGVRYGLYREGKDGIDDYETTRGEGFGAEARRRIILGTYVLSAGYYDAYYGKATALRERLTRELREVLGDVDCIATPTMPTPAFRIGEKSDPVSLYLEDVFTVPGNLTGMPAISVPMGKVEDEGTMLPVGIQFMAAHGAESVLFDIGKRFLGEVQ